MDVLADLLGQAPAVVELREQIRRILGRTPAARRPPPILILGETGTGKNLVARVIHRAGPRGDRPFVDVNCAAIPDGLLEAELFGFERGAFTDARQAKAGLFQTANGGTIFLDEIALLPDPLQAKLLKVIEERTVRPLGGTRSEPVDVSIVAATNEDLVAAVGARRFRQDLYHRLAVLTLRLPPLRERRDDIPVLAEHFLARACADYGLPARALTPAARAALQAYDWPGNVRELVNVMERVALLADTSRILPEMLALPAGGAVPEGGFPGAAAQAASLDARVEAWERDELLRALEETRWNVVRAAARLGISRGTIRYRIGKYGLESPPRHARTRPPLPAPPVRSPRLSAARACPPAVAAVAVSRWERRLVALLAVTVRDLDADDSPIELGRDFDTIVQKIESFGGRIEEAGPWRIVGAFGVDPAEDAPRRAALAAMAVRNALARVSQSQARRAITLAIHADHCPVGQVSGTARMDRDVRREMTMVLENLDADAEADTVVVSVAARSLLGRRFELDDARLLGYQRHPFGVAGHPGPFVGRDRELGILRARWQQALAGRGQIVALVGEPGIGKSRLLFEFRRTLGEEPLVDLEGRGESYGGGMPYLPVIALLRGFLRVDDRDDPAATGEKVRARILALDRALAPDIPAILALLDAAGVDPEWRKLDPAQRRQRTLDALARLVLRLSQDQPVVIVIEDLHWIDAETQACLDRLVLSVPAARILVLVSYRPEYRHTMGGGTPYTQLHLDPLPPASAEELVCGLVGEDSALRPLAQLLIERTGGNPFFLEESVRTLVETQELVGERGAYRPAHDVHALEVPATVHAVLAARIDRLTPEDRRLLQAAAVIGTDVPFALLLGVAGLDEDALRQGLARLQAAELVYEARLFPELEYTFKHALTHEVAYGTLPTERRQALHCEVVSAIERLFADRIGEHVERLAHHAVRGGLRERAVKYLRQAGEKAVARSANREAVTVLEQALGVLRDLPESPDTLAEAADVRIALGPALIALRGAAADIEVLYRQACDAADRLGDATRLYLALWGRWIVSYAQGRYPAARELSERLLAVAEAGGDAGRLVEAHHAAWATLTAMGDLAASLTHAERGVALYDPERHGSQAFLYGGHDAGVCGRSFLALARWSLGYPDAALAPLRDARALAERLDHPMTMVLSLCYAGWVYYYRGDRPAAREAAERTVALGTTHGFSSWIDDGAVVLASLEVDDGADRRRLTETFESLNRLEGRAIWRKVICFTRLAAAFAAVGDVERGLAALAAIPEGHRSTIHASEIERVRGELLLRSGAQDEAERAFRNAVEIARHRSERSLELRAATSLARFLDDRGKRDEARATLDPIYRWFTEGFDTADLREARALLDALA